MLIVDDNASFRAAASAALDGPDFAVVGEAATAAEALAQIDALRPDIVLIDIRLGEDNGFELSRRVAHLNGGGGPTLILISTQSKEAFADLVAASPAHGFVAKAELSPESLAELVRSL
jgi:DNA-binding NarL/FixJ family response regulator